MTDLGPLKDVQGLFLEKSSEDFLQAAKLEDATGLCLSGGGYRAMIYHVGAIIRLNELGFLPRLQEIASVSGGSITAGALAVAWPKLVFDTGGCAVNLINEFALPILQFAKTGIDIRAILFGLLPGCSAADSISHAYDKYLFHGANLQDVPDFPRFTFMATNLQTGSGWRFSKAYAADYRVGKINNPHLPLSRVVAASSAFPPMLSPVRIKFSDNVVEKTPGADLHRSPFIDEAVLSDGGVYDNLGLERIWKRCKTIMVSNAGRTIPEIGKPSGRWIGQMFRTTSLIQQQAESSRKRILFGMDRLNQRNVAYWGIDTPVNAYGLVDALPMTSDDAVIAAAMRTRLNPFSAPEIDLLLKAGYAGSDASLRVNRFAENNPAANFNNLPLATKSQIKLVA